MAVEIIIPSEIEQGIILKWLKNDMELVMKDEDLVEIESDKANITIPAPATGIFVKHKEENEIVNKLEVIGLIENN